jgi:DNA polymerase-3 subunit gamma/tau
MKAIEARNAVSLDAVLKRLHELRGDAGTAAPSPPSAVSAGRPPAVASTVTARKSPEVTAKTAQATSGLADAVILGDVNLQALWPSLVEAIGRASPFARSYFIEAHPVSFVKDVLTIGFDPEFADHIAMVDNVKNHTLIATKLAELGHPRAQVKIVKAERPDTFVAPAPPAAPPEAPATKPGNAAPAPRAAAPAPPAPASARPVQLDPSEFKNDPLIKKALEVFKGTIVEVRA